jgi:hypothetical protein
MSRHTSAPPRITAGRAVLSSSQSPTRGTSPAPAVPEGPLRRTPSQTVSHVPDVAPDNGTPTPELPGQRPANGVSPGVPYRNTRQAGPAEASLRTCHSPARNIPGSSRPSLSKSATTGRSPARPNPNRTTVLPPTRNAQRPFWLWGATCRVGTRRAAPAVWRHRGMHWEVASARVASTGTSAVNPLGVTATVTAVWHAHSNENHISKESAQAASRTWS